MDDVKYPMNGFLEDLTDGNGRRFRCLRSVYDALDDANRNGYIWNVDGTFWAVLQDLILLVEPVTDDKPHMVAYRWIPDN